MVKPMRSISVLTLFALLLMLGQGPAAAVSDGQYFKVGNITTKAVDTNGNIVKNPSVTLIGPGGENIPVTIDPKTGAFTLPVSTPGVYKVTINGLQLKINVVGPGMFGYGSASSSMVVVSGGTLGAGAATTAAGSLGVGAKTAGVIAALLYRPYTIHPSPRNARQ